MLTPEQLELRKKGIGGSDAAKVAGLSRWGTPFEVYQDKLNLAEARETTEAMKIGSALEPIILDKYESLTGHHVKRDNETIFNKKNKFMLATVDGLVTDKNIIVEAKTAKNSNGWGEARTCDIPVDYLCQVAHYCAVLDVPTAHIIVFFKFNESYELYKYDRNENLETALVKKECHFWNNHIVPQIPPAITKVSQAKVAYKFAEEVTAFADNETKKKFGKLRSLINKKKELEALEDELKTDLMLTMGVASELKDGEGNKLISWKNVTSERFDTTQFKQSNPDLYRQFVKEQTIRRFLPNYILEI